MCARARLNALPVEIAAAPRASSRRETKFREREIERISETRVVESRRVKREVKKRNCFEYPSKISIFRAIFIISFADGQTGQTDGKRRVNFLFYEDMINFRINLVEKLVLEETKLMSSRKAGRPNCQPASPLGKLARERGVTVLLEESIT